MVSASDCETRRRTQPGTAPDATPANLRRLVFYPALLHCRVAQEQAPSWLQPRLRSSFQVQAFQRSAYGTVTSKSLNEVDHGSDALLAPDSACDTRDFVAVLRERRVTPHVAQNVSGRRSAIDDRTTRHPDIALASASEAGSRRCSVRWSPQPGSPPTALAAFRSRTDGWHATAVPCGPTPREEARR